MNMKRIFENTTQTGKRLKSQTLADNPDSEHVHGKIEIETNISVCGASDQNPRSSACAIEQLLSRSSFELYPISSFDKNFPNFRQPNEIGHFSQDYKRTFANNSSQLKCYCPPNNVNNVDYNLHHGYDIYIKRDESVKEYLDDLLRWILLHNEVFTTENHKSLEKSMESSKVLTNLSTDFVSWRGLHTKLLCTPYENREGWKIAVTRFNNTLYMCEYETDEKKEQRKYDTEKQKEMTYWGVKFEQYVTAKDGEKPVTDKAVNNHEAFCSVVRTRLNKHSLVFGGEIDCYETIKGKQKYVELKTSREMDHHRQLTNFKRFKLIKWWAQSFMVGIEKIICGFRDDDGVVHRLEDYTTVKIPQLCKDIPNCWAPNVCFNFVDQFLQYVKDIVVQDNPRVAYVFTWQPKDRIRCTQYPSGSQYSFLPDWYIQKMSPESGYNQLNYDEVD